MLGAALLVEMGLMNLNHTSQLEVRGPRGLCRGAGIIFQMRLFSILPVLPLRLPLIASFNITAAAESVFDFQRASSITLY